MDRISNHGSTKTRKKDDMIFSGFPFDEHRDGFVAMRVDCDPRVPLRVVVEEKQ